MYIFGKILGLLVGFYFFGFPGIILGLFLGHLIDLTWERIAHSGSSDQEDLIPVLFSLFGLVASHGKSLTQAQVFFLQTSILTQLNMTSFDLRRGVNAFQKTINSHIDIADEDLLSEIENKAKSIAEDFFLDRRTRFWIYATCRQLAAFGNVRPGIVEILDSIAKAFGIFEETGSAGFDNSSNQSNYQSEWSTFKPKAGVGPEAFEVLGLKPEASNDEIKKAYRSMVRQYHPDHLNHLSDSDPQKKTAQEKFIQIQNAYEGIRRERKF